jgi:hypothetical protein
MNDVRDYHGRYATLRCVNGHDRCYLGPDENCPYCERVNKRTRVQS